MWKEMHPVKRAEIILTTAFALWLALVLLVPFTLPAGQVTDLSGRVGRIDNPEQIGRMNPLAAAVYWLGDLNCHQIADRSFFLNGNELPFCARDLGIFAGLVLGMLIALVIRPRTNWLLTFLLFLPLVVDGGAQLVSTYESDNLLRLATGILAGLGAALLLHAFGTFRASPRKRMVESDK